MKSLLFALFFFIGSCPMLTANHEIPAKDSHRSDSAIVPPKKQNTGSMEQDTSSASRKPAESAEERPTYLMYMLVGVLVIGGGIMWMESRKSER